MELQKNTNDILKYISKKMEPCSKMSSSNTMKHKISTNASELS